MNPYLELSEEVAYALAHAQPIVAFETTILSFGLPSPLNEQVAFGCERLAREYGAVPATVALLEGKVRVGLHADEIRYFCSRKDEVTKVNLQNFAATLAEKRAGALTVAASMQACALAGIRVFATGGIGGVHRGFSQTLDISSDLRALAQLPVAVVCAGAKSILDVAATLEALETLGVPVAGFATRSFPLFYARESTLALETVCNTAAELARLVRTHFATATSGVLVANPIPAEKALTPEQLEVWVAQALKEAADQGISGKRLTPYLLERLEHASAGKTLEANQALVFNNSRVAAQLAVELRAAKS